MIGNTTDLIAYAAARDVTIDPAKASGLLQKATDYLDGLCWIGSRANDQQDDSWPRVDGQGKPITGGAPAGIPKMILNASYRLAMEASTGVVLTPSFAGKQVVEERVEGAVDIKYDKDSLYNAPSFPWLDAMLTDYIECEPSLVNFSVMRG